MKLPLGWLAEFVKIEADVAELGRRLTLAGLEVENVERHQPGFSGVTVARVVKVERHPNADRLSLCEVDPGDGSRVSIVCGAPNVHAGMRAALARVGARLVGADKGEHGDGQARLEDAPPLEAAVIRGVRSEGMLCSERELGLSSEHAGIVELDGDAPLGTPLADYLRLGETVFDVAVLPNRGDCLSVLGLAREVAALFELKFKPPRVAPARARPGDPAPELEVQIDDADHCPRYAALAIRGVKIAASPMWMRRRLALFGIRSVNNVVDITNYVMLELGQPLHAFDLEKIEGGRIVIRRAGEDREFVTLDGLRRELRPDDLMICDGVKPLALAGVMGGMNSEVSGSTTSLLLESAYFEPMAIARTSRRLGLRSEASYRFERGIDRTGQVVALHRAAALLRKLTGGRPAGDPIDLEARPAPRREIVLDLGRMSALLGVELPAAKVKRRLQSVGAAVVRAGKGEMIVTPPSFRLDLNELADLAEEVARIPGLAEIPEALPLRNSSPGAPDSRRSTFKATRDALIGAGLTEIRSIGFVNAADNRRYPGLREAEALAVSNPLSAEFSELRASLIPGLVTALRFNLNRSARSFHAFELGRVYVNLNGAPAEQERIAALSFGEFGRAAIGEHATAGDYLTLKGALETCFEALGIVREVQFARAEPERTPYLHPGKSARLAFDGQLLGYLGELHPSEMSRIGINGTVAACELDFGVLLAYKSSPHGTKTISAPPRFPAITRDLALVIDRDFPADTVVKTTAQIDEPLLESVELFDAYEGSSVPAGKKSLALSCTYRAKDRTLTDEEINGAHARLTQTVMARLGAELRH